MAGCRSDQSSAGLLVPDLTVHERHEDLRGVNLTGRNFKQVTIQYDEIRELADLDRADLVIRLRTPASSPT
jgi:uncharacterized protein YjbI with pentapeptide repeats